MATNSKTPAKPLKCGTISKVRVIVRVRPFLPHEIDPNHGNSLSCVSAQFDSSDEVSILLKDQDTSRHECYKLDAYFGEEDNSVSKIFEKEVRPLIHGVFHGCNATVFAYGATGSGKTYTMQGTDENPGLMPLAMSRVLSMCQTTGSIAEISYYEVYLDRCYDLLELKTNEISVLDDKEGQIHLRGLARVKVNSMSEFYEVFTRGIQKRKVAYTGLNDVSSRSHGVLVIIVSTPSNNGSETTTMGKLNLIDLAGNEDNKRSGNEGIRMQESAKINQSLCALSNVIYALNNNKVWIPYRESKLTRILKDSLGGTSRTLMVACLNPGDYQESVYTVSLAARSRHISNVIPSSQKQETPKAKIDMEEKLRAWLESKGKTKSSQRTGAFGSPFLPKTPGSMSSMKKHVVNHSSLKAKAASQGTCTMKDRFMSVRQTKLFDRQAPSDSTIKDSVCGRGLEDIKDCFSGTKELSMVLEDGHLSSNLRALNFAESHHCLSQVQELVAKDTIKECTINRTGIKSAVSLPDEILEAEENLESNRDIFQSPPYRPKNRGCGSTLRKPLSPINLNISITRMPVEEISSRHNMLAVPLESDTPRTPFVSTREKFVDFNTPLDKFNARSSNLKSFLAEEYIDFLNTATRDELVELKGIGEKRAEYIIELRETSPLKTLNDLEKIGLSSKQVHHMFCRAARGIFQ